MIQNSHGTNTDATADPSTPTVFGLAFSPIDQTELVATLTREAIPPGEGARSICTANLDHIVQLARNEAFRAAYDNAWIITADGKPVHAYARWRKAVGPTRVTGSDLVCALMPTLPASWARCFFVAPTESTATALAAHLQERGFPAASIAYEVPPLGFEHDAGYSQQLADAIRCHRTTHLFFGVGAPKSEIWTHVHREAIGDCYVLCCGAGLDFFAGTKRRAPPLLRQYGFEWVWRFAQEPRRLFRRYLVNSWAFGGEVIRDLTSPRRASHSARD